MPYHIISYYIAIISYITYHITISLSQMHPCYVCFLKSPFSSVKSVISVLWPRDTWLPVAISGPSLRGRPNCTTPSDETRQAAASWRYQGDIMGISWGYTTNNIPTTCSGYIIGLVYGNAGILIEFLDIGVNRLPQNMINAYNTNLC